MLGVSSRVPDGISKKWNSFIVFSASRNVGTIDQTRQAKLQTEQTSHTKISATVVLAI
jgi:hypothetical protein